MRNLNNKSKDELWGDIAENGPESVSTSEVEKYYRARNNFTRNYSWAVPTEGGIKDIKEFVGGSPVLEFGAGLGLWSRLLEIEGVNTRAYDVIPTNDNYYRADQERFTRVSLFSPQQLLAIAQESQGLTLMLCWPCYDKSWAYEIVEAMKPSKIVYIGERKGGCTGDVNFHRVLRGEYQSSDNTCSVIPNWQGIRDDLFLYERRTNIGSLVECTECEGTGKEPDEGADDEDYLLKCYACDGFGSNYE